MMGHLDQIPTHLLTKANLTHKKAPGRITPLSAMAASCETAFCQIPVPVLYECLNVTVLTGTTLSQLLAPDLKAAVEAYAASLNANQNEG
jgi:hypothetical protein